MDSNVLVNIGVQRFDRMREQKAFYIDKMDFIREWWQSGSDVALITRLRRFGKTLRQKCLEK
ncbi:MAG: AAA family ATPase [Lachnospiraceae bacterium]|nr:AAA family ATPase [Lachnospiraceae bacterium]